MGVPKRVWPTWELANIRLPQALPPTSKSSTRFREILCLSEWIMLSPMATLRKCNMMFRRHITPSGIIMSFGERLPFLFE